MVLLQYIVDLPMVINFIDAALDILLSLAIVDENINLAMKLFNHKSNV